MMMDASSNIDELVSLLKRNPADAIKTDEDLTRFCEVSFELIHTASGQSIAADRPVWDEFELALALREGAVDSKHIDFDHVSHEDHKMFIMYRKFGFRGLETTIEAIGPRRTFALARLAAGFRDVPGGIVPFSSSARAWARRVARQAGTYPKKEAVALEIYCLGPKTRSRIDRPTWVIDVIPASHEAILPDPDTPCTRYIPEVHVLIYGPPPQQIRRPFWGPYSQWLPVDCLVDLAGALANIDNTGPSCLNAVAEYLESRQAGMAARRLYAKADRINL